MGLFQTMFDKKQMDRWAVNEKRTSPLGRAPEPSAFPALTRAFVSMGQ
jgi:hypothetical protein